MKRVDNIAKQITIATVKYSNVYIYSESHISIITLHIIFFFLMQRREAHLSEKSQRICKSSEGPIFSEVTWYDRMSTGSASRSFFHEGLYRSRKSRSSFSPCPFRPLHVITLMGLRPLELSRVVGMNDSRSRSNFSRT